MGPSKIICVSFFFFNFFQFFFNFGSFYFSSLHTFFFFVKKILLSTTKNLTGPRIQFNFFFSVTPYLFISRLEITNKSVLLAENLGKSPNFRSGQDF